MSRWLTAQGLDVSDLTTQAERFLSARRAAGYTHHWTGQAVRPMLTSLCTLGVAPPAPAPVPTGPVEVMLARDQSYLTIERGLWAATARGYIDSVRPCLPTRRVSPDGLHLGLEHLSAADVTALVVAHTPNQSRRAAKLTVLRSFLRTETALAWAIQPTGTDPSWAASYLRMVRGFAARPAATGSARIPSP